MASLTSSNIAMRLAWAGAMLFATGCFAQSPRIDPDDGSGGSTEASGSASEPSAGTSDASVSASSVSSTEGETTLDGGSTVGDTDSTSSDPSTTGTSDETGTPPAFCENLGQEFIICTDFDEDSDVPVPWIPIEIAGAFVDVGDHPEAPSPPNVLESTALATMSEPSVGMLSTELGVLQFETNVSARVELDETCGSVTVLDMDFRSSDTTYLLVGVRLSPSTLELDVTNEMGGLTTTPLDGDLIAVAGPFPEIRLLVDVEAKRARVYVDGELAGEAETTAAALPPNPPYIHVGVSSKQEVACAGWVDDILVY